MGRPRLDRGFRRSNLAVLTALVLCAGTGGNPLTLHAGAPQLLPRGEQVEPVGSSASPAVVQDPAPHTEINAAESAALLAAPAAVGGTIEPGSPLFQHRGSGILGPFHYDESDRWLDFGILVQTEYLNNAPTNGDDTQYLFFRRLRPTLMGGMNDWQGILQMDFGSGENGTASATTVRWVNFQYTGFFQSHVTFGSFKPWFSRELLTMGPHLQTIERSPVGDTNYGNPDYMLGIAWDQMLPNNKLAYYFSAGLEDHEQSVTQMQMRSPANAASGSNSGTIVSARVDYYVFGEMPYDKRPLHTPPQVAYNRGDFHTAAWRVIVSSGVFGWWNNGTSNPYTVNGVSTSTTNADLNQSYGAEVSGGLRGFGVSADVEYQYIAGSLLDPTFTGGMYVAGATDLNKFSINGGYMLPRNVELATGWSVVDATGFQTGLTETKLGLNWYVMKYAVRFSGQYSFLDNNAGLPGNDIGITRVSAQFAW